MLCIACNQATVSTTNTGETVRKDSLVKRGKYLVAIMGCGDCRSPKVFGPMGPQADTRRLFSGYPANMPVAVIDTAALKNWVFFKGMTTAVAGPWGVSFSANII